MYLVFALCALLAIKANAEETFSLEARYLTTGQSYAGAKVYLGLGSLQLKGTTGILLQNNGIQEAQYTGDISLGLFSGISIQGGAAQSLGNRYEYGGIEVQVFGKAKPGIFSSGRKHTRHNSWY